MGGDLALFDVAPEKSAWLSDDGQYRYTLGRRWARGERVAFIMLNPSTADATEDDPTIRRCIGFAKSWGYAGIEVANLYAYRATLPTALLSVPDPIGPENDAAIRAVAFACIEVIVAWGANKVIPGRIEAVAAMLPQARCLGVTKDGSPRHPLYLAAHTERIPWSVR